MSEGAGAGREQPPVRLETVATATGLRSPATRLQGGDAPSHPSPIPRGAAASGRRGRGDTRALPLAVEGTSPPWPVWVCLPPQTVEGGGGGRAPYGHDLAPTWLQSSQQGFWGGCKRGGVLACRGRRSHEGWARGLCPAIPTVATTTRLRNEATKLGAPEVCSLPGERKEAHIPPPHGRVMCQMRLGPVVGLCSVFQATVLQGGVGAAWAGAEEKTLLTPGS